MISRSAINDLYGKALKLPFLKLEDVFVTGIAAHLLNIKRIYGFDIFNFHFDENIAFDTSSDICNLRKMISIHFVNPNKQYDLWNKQMDIHIKC